MILVTGATGFLGAQLVKHLVKLGQHVVCIKRATSVIPTDLQALAHNITWHDADMLDVFALEDALADITQVYHCAAMVTFNPRLKKQILQTNIQITANLVNLCVQQGIRLVHVSSIAAIGHAKPGELITEKNHAEEIPNYSAYALSKYESEMEVWRGFAEGLNGVIVNPSLIIGASGGTNGTGQLFEVLKQGLHFYPIGGCGFVDVDDVAACMISLMQSDITNQRFIVNAYNLSYQEFFTLSAQALQVEAPTSPAKPWVLGIAWRAAAIANLFTGRHEGIDRASATAASKTLFYDNTKLQKAINHQFKPLELTLNEIAHRFNS